MVNRVSRCFRKDGLATIQTELKQKGTLPNGKDWEVHMAYLCICYSQIGIVPKLIEIILKMRMLNHIVRHDSRGFGEERHQI